MLLRDSDISFDFTLPTSVQRVIQMMAMLVEFALAAVEMLTVAQLAMLVEFALAAVEMLTVASSAVAPASPTLAIHIDVSKRLVGMPSSLLYDGL